MSHKRERGGGWGSSAKCFCCADRRVDDMPGQL